MLGESYICGRLAQLGEHLPYKQGVTGSTPVAPTRKLKLIIWPGSSVGLECQPVTLEVEGSSPFRVARLETKGVLLFVSGMPR